MSYEHCIAILRPQGGSPFHLPPRQVTFGSCLYTTRIGSFSDVVRVVSSVRTLLPTQGERRPCFASKLESGRISEAFLYLRARHFLHLYATSLVARTLQLRIFRFASTYIKPSVLTLKLESPINYAHFSDLHIKVATIDGTFSFYIKILILKYRLCAFFNS